MNKKKNNSFVKNLLKIFLLKNSSVRFKEKIQTRKESFSIWKWNHGEEKMKGKYLYHSKICKF